MSENKENEELQGKQEEFGELLKYTGTGFLGGIALAFVLVGKA